MGVCAMYAYNAAVDAIEHAGLKQKIQQATRYGIAGGSGGNSTASVAEMIELLEEKGARKIGPFFVPRNMSNTITATWALHSNYKVLRTQLPVHAQLLPMQLVMPTTSFNWVNKI